MQHISDEDFANIPLPNNTAEATYGFSALAETLDDAKNGCHYTYRDLLMLYESTEYDRLTKVIGLYESNFLPQFYMRVHEKYFSFMQALYKYLAKPMNEASQ